MGCPIDIRLIRDCLETGRCIFAVFPCDIVVRQKGVAFYFLRQSCFTNVYLAYLIGQGVLLLGGQANLIF